MINAQSMTVTKRYCAVVSVPCSLVVNCWERADLLAVVLAVSWLFPKCVLVHLRIKGKVGAVKLGLSPPVKYFTDRSKGVLFCGYFMFSLSCVCYAFVCVCLYVPCGHLLGKG